jgi:Zn finger protein HypA/HybF involved in hydrogenase expression
VLERSKKLVMSWRSRLRLHALVVAIGVPLAVLSAIAVSPAWLMLPLVGMGVAAVTMTFSKIGQRLNEPTCWTCGHDLKAEPGTEHGVVCPECGSLNQSFLLALRGPVRPTDAHTEPDDLQA